MSLYPSGNQSTRLLDIPINRNTHHYYWLDLLRFLAAFLVLACHCRGFTIIDYTHLPPQQQSPLTFTLFSITRLGHEAVLIFFVLSGFLVGGRLIEKVKSNQFNLINYTIDRVVRIMLPLISALILIFIVNLVTGNPDHKTIFDYIGNLFSLQGIYVTPVSEPLWSLSYEVWFYILAGATAVILYRNYYSTQSYIPYAFLVFFVCILVFAKLNALYLSIWTFGAIAYNIRVKSSKLILWGAICGIISLIVLLQLTSGSQLSSNLSNLLPTTNRDALQIWYTFFACILIRQVIMFAPKYKFSSRIERFGTKLAAFSYTLYLTHVPTMRLLEHFNIISKADSLNIRSVTVYLASMLICIIVAYCIYWCFEKRNSDVKNFIKSRINRVKSH